MKQEISSLMDGELDHQGSDQAIRACCTSEAAARTWDEYHLIGDALRGEPGRGRAIAERVSAALASEPTVLAPRAARPSGAMRVALAAAASVATIAVVGWIGAPRDAPAPAGPVAAVAPVALPLPAAVSRPSPARATSPAPDVRDYLAAHRQIPSAEFYRPVAAKAP